MSASSVTQAISKILHEWRTPEVLAAVLDQISDAIILYDRDLRITGINRAAERLFGFTSEDVIGRTCQEVFRCGVCEPGCGMLVGINHAPSCPQSTVRIHTDHGTERLVVIRTTQVHSPDGRLLGVIATVRDITEEVAPQKRGIVAVSPVMRRVMDFVKRVAASEATTILLEGENGVGKDLIAKTIHYESRRQAEPFVAINCAAIPETLLESELFGYEKGAFTDARSQKRGIFELADKGTLFLDEVGEIPLAVQVKLLRVLEEQSFRRLGGLNDIKIDVRVIAATNKNLREAVKEGAFRQDLYFRLNVIQITIPPLRERREDIIPLAKFFIEQYNKKFKRNIEGLTPEAERLLLEHDWPGNVRELRNAIERAMILEEGQLITPESLPLSVGARTGPVEPVPATPPQPAQDAAPLPSLEEAERRLILKALERTNWNQTRAAQLLKITRDTLRYKMKKYKLQKHTVEHHQ